MATFKTSAILELIDKTRAGAESAIRNFGRVEKAADAFGDEASKSADNVKKSFREFTFEQRKAQNRLKELRSDLRSGKGDFASIKKEIDDVSKSLKNLNRENEDFRLGQKIGGGIRRGFGAARRGLFVGGGLLAAGTAASFGLANSFAQQADDAGRLAENTGFAVESITALAFATQQLAGQEGADALPDAVKELNKRIGELGRGEGTLTGIDKRFASILLSADGTEDAFVKIREEINKSNLDSQELGTLLDKLFGEAGFRITPLFQASNQELSDLLSKARDLGVVLDEDAVDSGRRFLEAWNNVKARFAGISLDLGGVFADAFVPIFDEVIEPRLRDFQNFIGNLDPQDVEDAFRNVAGFLEDAALFVADIAQTVADFGGSFVVSGRERRALERIGNDPELLEEYENRLGLFRTYGERQRVAVELVDEQDEIQRQDEERARQAEETNRLLQELVTQGATLRVPFFGVNAEVEGNAESGFTFTPSTRSIGTRVDSGQEVVGAQ